MAKHDAAGHHGVNFIASLTDSFGIGRYENLASAIFVAALVLIGVKLALGQLRRAANPLVPDTKLSARNILDLVLGFVVSLGDDMMGKENRKYIPFVATIFVYIFSMNLLGLVPGFSTPTDHIPFNLGIALIVFLLYNFWGIKEIGIVAYLKHLGGPIIFLAPFIFVVELISHFVRPVTLTLRLFGNMTADHAVLTTFTELTRVIIPVCFLVFGTLVCFVQAFVFTALTMIYISLAVAHDDEHEGEEAHAH